jgi:hypothetical protein
VTLLTRDRSGTPHRRLTARLSGNPVCHPLMVFYARQSSESESKSKWDSKWSVNESCGSNGYDYTLSQCRFEFDSQTGRNVIFTPIRQDSHPIQSSHWIQLNKYNRQQIGICISISISICMGIDIERTINIRMNAKSLLFVSCLWSRIWLRIWSGNRNQNENQNQNQNATRNGA